MSELGYRAPNELELAFLWLVARDYPELSEQIDHCAIAEYDHTGWCDVLVRDAAPVHIEGYHLEGPTLRTEEYVAETVLSFNTDGMLQSVEVIDYGSIVFEAAGPYRLFVEASAKIPSPLQYPEKIDVNDRPRI